VPRADGAPVGGMHRDRVAPSYRAVRRRRRSGTWRGRASVRATRRWSGPAPGHILGEEGQSCIARAIRLQRGMRLPQELGVPVRVDGDAGELVVCVRHHGEKGMPLPGPQAAACANPTWRSAVMDPRPQPAPARQGSPERPPCLTTKVDEQADALRPKFYNAAKKAATSRDHSSGCSSAGKCPPRGCSRICRGGTNRPGCMSESGGSHGSPG
jgi:hypothetical protein